MSADRSMSGASSNGSRMPTTVNHWPPRYTCGRPVADVMPSRSAALAPSTTAGYRAVASLRNAPSRSDAAQRRRAARARPPARLMPPVSDAEHQVAAPHGHADTASWRRLARPGRCGGSSPRLRRAASAPSPKNVCPGRTWSRLVPRRSSVGEQVGSARRRDADHRHHRRDADGDARGGERRAAGPAPAGRASPRRARHAVASAHRRPPSSDDAAVAHRDPPVACARRSPASWVITTIVVRSACSVVEQLRGSPAPVRVSRLPVGSSASTTAGSPTSARAIATRWRSPPDSLPGPMVEPVAEADAARARPRRGRGARPRRTPRYSSPVATLSSARQAVEEVELLEHEADRLAPHRGQLAVGQRGDVVAGDRAPCPRSAGRARR